MCLDQLLLKLVTSHPVTWLEFALNHIKLLRLLSATSPVSCELAVVWVWHPPCYLTIAITIAVVNVRPVRVRSSISCYGESRIV